MRIAITAIAGLTVGAAFAILGGNREPPGSPVSALPPLAISGHRAADQSLERRVAELERALTVEREARQFLEDEIFLIARDVPTVISGEQLEAVGDEQLAERERFRARREGRQSREYRIDRMLEAGIDHAKAEWILRRESELQFEALQIRYEAGRNGDINDFYSTRTDLRNMLRQEIGDSDYERYLSANGMGTNVVVSSVLDASPARAAGLRPGDRITRYNGKRIFSMTDVTEEIMLGTPGESIVLEFERDGLPMQVQLPRGPIGISGGSG